MGALKNLFGVLEVFAAVGIIIFIAMKFLQTSKCLEKNSDFCCLPDKYFEIRGDYVIAKIKSAGCWAAGVKNPWSPDNLFNYELPI